MVVVMVVVVVLVYRCTDTARPHVADAVVLLRKHVQVLTNYNLLCQAFKLEFGCNFRVQVFEKRARATVATLRDLKHKLRPLWCAICVVVLW